MYCKIFTDHIELSYLIFMVYWKSLAGVNAKNIKFVVNTGPAEGIALKGIMISTAKTISYQ